MGTCPHTGAHTLGSLSCEFPWRGGKRLSKSTLPETHGVVAVAREQLARSRLCNAAGRLSRVSGVRVALLRGGEEGQETRALWCSLAAATAAVSALPTWRRGELSAERVALRALRWWRWARVAGVHDSRPNRQQNRERKERERNV